jgi:hypothetical protein
MHRIDGPGATVDNKFTDGDPVGGIQATLVTDDWLNDIQEELISILTAGSVTPVKGTQNQVLAAIRSLSPGIIGAARNARMSVATASATATFTADQVVVGASLGGATFRLNGLNKTINLGSVGAGGMDIGAAPVSGYVAIYAIYNPTTGVSALLAVNATSTLAPEVYGGANMPSGYTASALVSVWPTNASSLFVIGAQYDRSVGITPVTILTSVATVVPWTPLSSAVAVPRNAKSMSGYTAATATSGAGGYLLGLAALVNGAGAQIGEGYTAPASSVFSSFSDVQMPTPQVINYQIAVTGTVSAISGQIIVTGYKF